MNPRTSEALDPEYLPDWAAYQDDLIRRAVEYAARRSPEVAARLAHAGLVPERIRGAGELPLVPVLPKDSLPDLQAASPRFGGMLAVPVEELARIYVSPGPILDPPRPCRRLLARCTRPSSGWLHSGPSRAQHLFLSPDARRRHARRRAAGRGVRGDSRRGRQLGSSDRARPGGRGDGLRGARPSSSRRSWRRPWGLAPPWSWKGLS